MSFGDTLLSRSLTVSLEDKHLYSFGKLDLNVLILKTQLHAKLSTPIQHYKVYPIQWIIDDKGVNMLCKTDQNTVDLNSLIPQFDLILSEDESDVLKCLVYTPSIHTKSMEFYLKMNDQEPLNEFQTFSKKPFTIDVHVNEQSFRNEYNILYYVGFMVNLKVTNNGHYIQTATIKLPFKYSTLYPVQLKKGLRVVNMVCMKHIEGTVSDWESNELLGTNFIKFNSLLRKYTDVGVNML